MEHQVMKLQVVEDLISTRGAPGLETPGRGAPGQKYMRSTIIGPALASSQLGKGTSGQA